MTEKPEWQTRPRATWHLWSHALLYGDGNGRSSQLHMLTVGDDVDHLTDTGVLEHVVLNSAPPKGETEEAQPQGATDLKGEVEIAYSYDGKYYANEDAALAVYEAAGCPPWVEPEDPNWKMAIFHH